MSQFWLYFKLGLTHVLDLSAYDHILFLVALTLPFIFKDWKKVLILVSVFTLGHTLSLFLSVYKIVIINSALIEFLIPVTIFATALYNILTARKSNSNTTMAVLAALFFGLIHGFGFSNYFKQIIAGEESKLLPLLEFALGIEIAQVVIVLFVLIASYVFQNIIRVKRRDWVLVVSAIVIGVVIPMLSETYPY
jgi:hypothetical protein